MSPTPDLDALACELYDEWMGNTLNTHAEQKVAFRSVARLVQRKLTEAQREAYVRGSGDQFGRGFADGQMEALARGVANNLFPLPSDAPSAPPRIARLPFESGEVASKVNELVDAVNALVTRESR